MFGLARARLRSFATDAALESFAFASKAFKDSHPTWPWALGLSGSTLAIGLVLIRFTLHSAERDFDVLRKESNELVKSSIKQGVQLDELVKSSIKQGVELDELVNSSIKQGVQLEQIAATLADKKKQG